MMDAVCFQCLQDDRALEKDEETASVEEGGMNPPSPVNSTSDEEADEDWEAEPPPVVRRKVSFADAFGLDLVSVKEFDNVDVSESEVAHGNGNERRRSAEEFYMSCLFSVPSSQAELDDRLQTQMVELESIELLPGTTTLRGIIRVVNLCYNKCVYTRISVDQWNSYFDLPAEYVPGSSDRRTDRFTFTYTLVPPFEKNGTRVEFCLRYETPIGTFWANNKEMNYVLFCHQRGCVKETHTCEESGLRNKRSCLRAIRNEGAEERSRGTITRETLGEGVEERCRKEKADKKMRNHKEVQLMQNRKDNKSKMENVKQQHNVEHLAHEQDCLPQSQHKVPRTVPPVEANGLETLDSVPAPQQDNASSLFISQNSPRNWSNKPKQQENPDMEDMWAEGSHVTLSQAGEERAPSVNDTWETVPKGTDNGDNKESSVCKVWQTFLNAPRSEDHPAIPESAWLQTATSPSNKNNHQLQYTATTENFQTFQVGADTPTALHAHVLATCQRLSDSCETQLANVAFNAKDHQSDKACDSGPGDDNAATQDASQGSQTKSVIDTLQEFSLKGAPPVSKGSVDSSTECHTCTVWELEKDRIIGGAEKIEGDEALPLHTADLVTSSGESETTDMTVMLASQNATAGDRISVGAWLHGGLSHRGEGKVTGTAYMETDDTLAFKETIRQETKDGAGYVSPASRHGSEKEVEIFRPQEEEKSQRCAAEKCEGKSEGKKNGGNMLREGVRGEVEEENSRINQVKTHTLNKDGSVNNSTMEVVDTEGHFHDKASEESEESEGSGLGVERVFEEKESLPSGVSEQPLSESFSLPNQLQLIQANADGRIKTSDPPALTNTEERAAMEPKTMMDGKSFSCDGLITNPQEFNPTPEAARLESQELLGVIQRKGLTHDQNFFEILQVKRSHLQEEPESKKEDGDETNIEEVMLKESLLQKGAFTQCQPDTSHPVSDLKTEATDERVSIGKLNIEAVRERMGNVEDSQEEIGNALAELKEHELSAEVEISSHAEYESLSGLAKEDIASENRVSLEVLEPRLEEISIERFGEELLRRIWEEVFSQQMDASCFDAADVNGVDCSLADVSGVDENNEFDSGVYSLTTDTNSSLCEGGERPSVTNGSECSSEETNHSLRQQIPIFPQKLTALSSSAHLGEDLPISFAFHERRSLTEATLALSARMTEKSDACERPRQPEFSFNASGDASNKHPGSSTWRSILYIVFHITRLLVCGLLVGGFFAIFFLYDFSAFVSLYIFSLCWWFCVWKRHREPVNKTDGPD